MKVIDCTLTYHHGMAGVALDQAKTVEKDGWNAKILKLYSHSGTHMDAPLHFGVNDQTIDQIPLERCMVDAWLVDGPELRIWILLRIRSAREMD